MRWLYTILQVFSNYRNLKNTACAWYLNDVVKIDFKMLNEYGIDALILDFDGVLSFHGNEVVDNDVFQWLQGLIKDFPSLKLFILSNKPLLVREEFFSKNFPSIEFVIAPRKKPYPDGINQILLKSKIPKGRVCIVDDRLATGILAGVISNIRTCYIYPPRARRSAVEIFFQMLRIMERTVLMVF